jgi:hypothetical protein
MFRYSFSKDLVFMCRTSLSAKEYLIFHIWKINAYAERLKMFRPGRRHT